MRVHLQSHSHVSLQRLFLAFPLTIAPTQGRSVIRRRGYERLLVPGQEVTIEPFEAMFKAPKGGLVRHGLSKP